MACLRPTPSTWLCRSQERPNGAGDFRNRQANHVGIGPVDSIDEPASQTLNGVASCLSAWLPRHDIGGNLGVGKRAERDRGRNDLRQLPPGTDEGKPGEHLVYPVRECSQHPRGVCIVHRLAENDIAHHDLGVRSEHEGSGMTRCDCPRLLERDPLDITRRQLARPALLLDIRRIDGEVNAQHLEKCFPPRGSGGEDDAHAAPWYDVTIPHVEPLDRTAVGALRLALADQPLTAAKVDFAWRIAAGPALARATSVTWSPNGRLSVRAKSEAWRREVMRARPLILQRISQLIGPDAVRTCVVAAGVP